jgi:hypothetical protein
MDAVPAFTTNGGERGDKCCQRSAESPESQMAGSRAREEEAGAVSCRAYERLMAGETVSWREILREHPMLGQVTVPALVNAGVIQVTPDHDSRTGRIDFRLRKRDLDHGVSEFRRREDAPTRSMSSEKCA